MLASMKLYTNIYTYILEKMTNESEERRNRSFMWLTEQFSELGTVFNEASKNLIFIFS